MVIYMFKVSKEKLTDAFERFYELNHDEWGKYLPNMEEISDKIIYRIYAEEQPEKRYDNSLGCILGAVVYMANEKLKEKCPVRKLSLRTIEKMTNGCDHTAVHRAHKRIGDKIGDIYEFTIEELTDMVFQNH